MELLGSWSLARKSPSQTELDVVIIFVPPILSNSLKQFKSYEGLYFSLGSYLSSSEDLYIHFKYIKATTKTGRIKGVKRVTRKSNFYDVEKTKNFLMEARLPDAHLLINVCDQFDFVPDLI